MKSDVSTCTLELNIVKKCCVYIINLFKLMIDDLALTDTHLPKVNLCNARQDIKIQEVMSNEKGVII